MGEVIKKLSEKEIEIEIPVRKKISKEKLLAQKARIEFLLSKFK